MIDPEVFGKAMGALIKEATAPLLVKIEHLEKQLSLITIPTAAEIAVLIDADSVAKCAAELVRVPLDGKSITVEDVRPLVDELVSKAVEALPGPEKPEEIDLEALAKSAAALVPKAEDGTSITAEDLRPLVDELVSKAVEALPIPENGKDADMGALQTSLETLVKAIPPAQPLPAPSVDEVAATFERRFSDLTLSWERQARDTFEKAADRMPKPKDGRDAVELESFDLALADDGRTVTVKMQAGETVIEKSVKIAAVIDRETFKHDGAYEKGDGVSYGGSFWIAKCDAPKGVPGSGETDWRCAVKKGRDGKDLRENASKIDPTKGVSIK